MEIERKQAEEDLRRSRTILSEAEKLSHIGAWEWDLVSNRWTFSDEWLSIHGSHRRTLTPEQLLPITHPDDREAIEQAFDDVRNRIKPYEMEHRIIRQDTGEVRVVKARGQYVLDSAGKVARVYGFAVDITEQQQAEETRREKEARILEAQEVARLGFYLLDVHQGNWISSPVLDQIFGIPPDYERTVNRWADLVHPDERQKMLDYFSREVIGEGKPFDREYRIIRHRDKQVRWVHGLGRLQFHEVGRPIFMLVTIQDITDRKRAEEKLKKTHDELEEKVRERTSELSRANEQLKREVEERRRAEEALQQSERRFRNYFEQGLIGMAVTSLDKRWLEVNDRLCEILGYSREELVQTNWAALTHPDDVEPNLRLFNPLLAGEIERFTLNKRYLKKDGSIVHTTIHTRAFRKDDGTIDHIVTLIEDITARKQAEEALRISEEKYRGVAEACPDAIVMSDVNGRVLFASPQTWRLLGLADSDELVGRSVFDYVIENDRKRLAGNMSNVVEVGGRSSTEYTSLRQDGTTLPVEASSVVILDATGQLKAVMSVIRDITERKRAEEALQRERRTLEHLLQSSDHERQLIAYEIHDGLAQYLTGAIMQLQMSEHLRDETPEEATKAFDAGMAMVRQSLAEARRLISGVRPPILDESGVVAAVAHLVYDFRAHKGPKVEFHSKVDFDRLAPILENAIYRIAQEGLTNAWKHSQSKKVSVGLVQRGDQLRIVVRDQGIGFNPKTVEEGRFGLEGIRERARLLGGRSVIESTPGKGTLIVVDLPIVLRRKNGE